MRRLQIIGFIFLGLPVLLFSIVEQVSAASFQGLGCLTETCESWAYSVSADGSVVVGGSRPFSGEPPDPVGLYGEAFRWTSGDGMVGLGYLPEGSESSAYVVSADGSVVVGDSGYSGGPGPWTEAFRWTSGDGMVGLGYLTGEAFTSYAWGVSADGSVVVGGSDSHWGFETFRWTLGDGMVGLGFLFLPEDPASAWSQAFGVSADGSVVVGSSMPAEGDWFGNEAFRWTSGGGMVGLGYPSEGEGKFSVAWGVSSDGSVVVGYGGVSSFMESWVEAFRWTSADGMVRLGDLPGGDIFSLAYGVSADGSVVVGYGKSASGQEAFIWDSTNGMRSLKDVLTNDFALDLTGWTLTEARGISDDGLTIVGYGINPSGNLEGWRAHLRVGENQPPSIESITGPADPVTVNAEVETSATFSDPDVTDTHTATWDWGDGCTSGGVVNEAEGTVTGMHVYETPGVYTLTLTVADEYGAEATAAYHYVVVYDPEGGFVTGGGWIWSPEGAYASDPSLEGKANFGFVSKYKKGATVPTGQTEFQFRVAEFNFHSIEYDWLVVSGAKARYKGIGTINGEGEYKFILTAIDADINENDSFDIDRFRIKIWYDDTNNNESVVYDNGLGANDDEDNATTEISGGSIKIHDPK